MVPLKVALVIFMAGNLLDMGLRLNPRDAFRGFQNVRFVVYTLLWGFALGPTVAYAITRVVPLEPAYATGLLLLGMTPCAPFLPAIVARAKGDLGFTAAFMVLASAGTVVFMPLAVPLMIKGLTVGAWTIAKPLLMVVLLPLALGMLILQASPTLAARVHPFVKKTTGAATIAVLVLCVLVYGRGLLGVGGSLAVISQVIFFSIVTVFPYWLGVGLRYDQKIVLSAGMATRNIGAAMAPLFALAEMDQRATVMVVLGFPIMVIAALLAAKGFSRPVSAGGPDSMSSGMAAGNLAAPPMSRHRESS
jgi:bile acid:Na+ symporter, BASS family